MRGEKSIKVPNDVYDTLYTLKETSGRTYGDILRAALAQRPDTEQNPSPVKVNRKREAVAKEKIESPDPDSLVNVNHIKDTLYAPDAHVVGLSQTSKVAGTQSTIKVVSGDLFFYVTMPGECWGEFTTTQLKQSGCANALDLLRVINEHRLSKNMDVSYKVFWGGIIKVCTPERKWNP